MNTVIYFLKEWGWLIGSFGGSIGIIVGVANLYDILIRKPTQIIRDFDITVFNKDFNNYFDKCFKSTLEFATITTIDSVDISEVNSLVMQIISFNKDKKIFKGKANRKYNRLLKTAINFDKKHDTNVLAFVQLNDLLNDNEKYKPDISKIKFEFIDLYKAVYGYKP